MTEQRPVFEAFDWEAHTAYQRYHEQTLDDVLSNVGVACARSAAMFSGLNAADWQREGSGSDGQPRNIEQLASRAAHEAHHHLHDIRSQRSGGTSRTSTSPFEPPPDRTPCLQGASISRMTTLYIRDVSGEVAETLKERAAAEGKSLSAYVGAELAKIATRPTNAEIVAKLKARDRTTGPTSDDIVAAVQAGRR